MFVWRRNTTTMERRSIDRSFHRFICVSAPENHARNKMIYGLPLITMFCGHSWGDSPIIYTRDCDTHESYWRITPLMTTNIVINGSPYIILYFNREICLMKQQLPNGTMNSLRGHLETPQKCSSGGDYGYHKNTYHLFGTVPVINYI